MVRMELQEGYLRLIYECVMVFVIRCNKTIVASLPPSLALSIRGVQLNRFPYSSLIKLI